MTPFEDGLRQALRRQEPSEDFTARVLARCAGEDTKARRGFRPMWQMAAIAAGLLLVAGGTAYEQHEHEVKGMAAKRKLVMAMRIAGTKLQEVQQRVREVQE